MTTPTTNNTPSRTTHVYKVIDGCETKADVFGAQPGANKPAVIAAR